MDLKTNVTHAKSGDLFCRPATWMDLVKFFLLNFVLHAFTVNLAPGTPTLGSLYNSVFILLSPLSGAVGALHPIISCPILEGDKVERAMRSRALCMVVPLDFPGLSLEGKIVHGQHPRLHRPVRDRIHATLQTVKAAFGSRKIQRNQSAAKFKLVQVPAFNFKVTQLRDMDDCKVDLASSHSYLKAFTAIIQICYGSFELYTSRVVQFNKYGYAAYSLTVIPYILMSFINLIASACRPTYPSVYQVLYGGRSESSTTPNEICPEGDDQQSTAKPNTLAASEHPVREWISQEDKREIEEKTTGAVGYAYGTPVTSYSAARASLESIPEIRRQQISVLCGIMLVAIPYLIIYFLTGFQKQQSTVWQRSWIMSNIALGQIMSTMMWVADTTARNILGRGKTSKFLYGTPLMGLHLFADKWNSPVTFFLLIIVWSIIAAIPMVFSLVVVAQMLLQDEVCIKL